MRTCRSNAVALEIYSYRILLYQLERFKRTIQMILIAQNSPPPPAPIPDGVPIYPTFNVSLQNPLPSQGEFISQTYNFISVPLYPILLSYMGILLMKAIIKAFQK